MRICVPVSGSATNLEAILAAGIEPDLVITDCTCRGEQVAAQHGLALERLYRRKFYSGGKFDRRAYTDAFLNMLSNYQIELIPMAGFMTILGPLLFERYPGRLINLHPSLFKGMYAQFPGGQAVADTLAAGISQTGSTIHLATEELDAGPVLGMSRVPVLPNDTVESLWERLKVEERKLYPQVIKDVMSGKIDLKAKWQEWRNR